MKRSLTPTCSKRVICIVCALALSTCMFPAPVFADGTDSVSKGAQATDSVDDDAYTLSESVIDDRTVDSAGLNSQESSGSQVDSTSLEPSQQTSNTDDQATNGAQTAETSQSTTDVQHDTDSGKIIDSSTVDSNTQTDALPSAPSTDDNTLEALGSSTYTGSIMIGGNKVDCLYTLDRDTLTASIGDGSHTAIAKDAAGDVILPTTVSTEGITYTVTALENNCFKQCTGLTSTGLNDKSTITTFGNSCFSGCSGLISTGLKNNSSVTSLGDSCFLSCSRLTSTGLDGNSSVTSLGRDCFNYCTGLKSAGLTKNSAVEQLSESCFHDCTSMESTGLESNTRITALPDACFGGCTALNSTGLSNKDSSIQSLGNDCFDGCASLLSTGLDGNASVESLGDACFTNCLALTSTGLDKNKSVSSLGSLCFMGCPVLESTGLASNTKISSLSRFCFSNCIKLTSTGLDGNTAITSLDMACFLGCSQLSSTGLEHNSSVSSIAMACFACCANLKQAALPSSLTSLDQMIFTAGDDDELVGASALESVCFYGDKPTTLNDDWLKGTKENVKVYYLAERSGWSTADSSAKLRTGDTLLPLYKTIVNGGSPAVSSNPWCTLDECASVGRYAPGEKVAVSADQTNFDHWSVAESAVSVNVADATASSTTFVMPAANVTLTAQYHSASVPSSDSADTANGVDANDQDFDSESDSTSACDQAAYNQETVSQSVSTTNQTTTNASTTAVTGDTIGVFVGLASALCVLGLIAMALCRMRITSMRKK